MSDPRAVPDLSGPRWTVWVCAQEVCAPAMHIRTPERPIPICQCRVEAKRGGFYRYKDRVPVEVAPLEELTDAYQLLGLYAAYAPADVHERVRETYAGQREEADSVTS